MGAPYEVGPTGEFGLFLAPSHIWRPETLFVQLIAKIDESGTHGASDYMTMAGYAGLLGQWNRFDHKWRNGLRKAGLAYFHTKEHASHPFAAKAPFIADRHLMFGFVTRLDREDFERFYRAGGWGGKAQPDSMYGLCFRYCLSLVLDIALAEMAHDGLVLNFIVEDGHPNAGAPAEVIRQLKAKHISGVSEFLGAAVTGDKKTVWGLQAADGLASGAWHMEAAGPLDLGPVQRPSLSDAPVPKDSSKTPIFRCHIDAAELAKFKGDYFAHLEFRRQWGQKKRPAIASASGARSGEQPA